jgi:hypothetical protein
MSDDVKTETFKVNMSSLRDWALRQADLPAEETNRKLSSAEIISILKSVTKVGLDGSNDLDIWIDDDEHPCSKRSYAYGSFSQKLFELIHEELLKDE